jgi:hypothetical protein
MPHTVSHKCHAKGCNQEIPPRLLCCARHWRMVPKRLQAAIWKHYRPGQEIDKDPTPEYLEVMRQAIEAVDQAEGFREQMAFLTS